MHTETDDQGPTEGKRRKVSSPTVPNVPNDTSMKVVQRREATADEEIASFRVKLPFMSMQDAEGMTALMHAVRAGQSDIAAILLPQCTIDDVNIMNNDKWNALAFAAQFGKFEILEALIKKG